VLDDSLPVLSSPGSSWRLALQLLYVVHQGKQLPLRIHLVSGSEREAAQVVIVQIAEDGFDDAEAPAVQQSPCTAVDSGFHRGGLRVQVLGLAAVECSLIGVD
jgi:hypothetical protein